MTYTPKVGDRVTWGGIGPYTVTAVGKWYALVVAENGMEYPAAITHLGPIPDTVTITINREDAESVVRELPEASADFAFGRVALACRAALEGGAMSDTYDPVKHIRASQPANDALLAHWKSHPDYDPERGLVFTGPSLPPESFERMVTLTISAKHAWRICGYLSVWEANDDWTRDAYEEFRAALEGEQ